MTHTITVASVVEAARRRFDEIQAVRPDLKGGSRCQYQAPCIIGTALDAETADNCDNRNDGDDTGIDTLFDDSMISAPDEDRPLLIAAQDVHDLIVSPSSPAPVETRRFWITRLIDALEARNADLIADLRGEITKL